MLIRSVLQFEFKYYIIVLWTSIGIFRYRAWFGLESYMLVPNMDDNLFRVVIIDIKYGVYREN
jgi:hypothetical protein